MAYYNVCPNCGSNLDPGENATVGGNVSRREAGARKRQRTVRGMEATLQQQAEHYLGAAIEPSEWDKAKAYAERKLKGIIEREGDGDGARRQPWYLAQLIAETVRGSRFSQLTIDFMEIFSRTDDMGVKKGQPVS